MIKHESHYEVGGLWLVNPLSVQKGLDVSFMNVASRVHEAVLKRSKVIAVMQHIRESCLQF